MNNRLSKLNPGTVRHRICSNPYDLISSNGMDLLSDAVMLALSNLHKLRDTCKFLSDDKIEQSLLVLTRTTEQLHARLGPDRMAAGYPKEEVVVPPPPTTRPWANTPLPEKKRAARRS